jgi:hypothetical protein
MQHQLPDDLHILALTVDMPDDEIKGVIAQVAPRVHKAQFGAVLTISGYDDDPRELYQIPECVDFFKRLSNLGLISILEVSSSLDGVSRFNGPAPGIGAFEVWAFGHRKITPGKEFHQNVMLEFFAELEKANKKCEAVMRESDKWTSKAHGYLIQQGKTTSYVMPEGQHRHGNPQWN